MKSKATRLIIAIILCQVAGIVGSIFTFPAISGWYVTLTKPFFSPPNNIFGPVWTILYTLMGISLFLVWNRGLKHKKVKEAISIFAIQLFLNTLWSILFFGLKSPGLAFIEIIVLWYFIVITIRRFAYIDKWAAYLLFPYLLWVSFAGLLNFTLWQLNS